MVCGGCISSINPRGPRLFVELGVRNNEFLSGLKAAEMRIRKFGESITALGKQIVKVGIAGALPLILSANTFARFDDEMRAVQAAAEATSADFERLTETARRLGTTTSFTAVNAAEMMKILARAGFVTDEVDAMTASVLNLARATGTDAEEASGVMAAAIRQFGLGAEDAAQVSDVLTAAANKTFNSIHDIGLAQKYANPIAKEFNLKLTESAAIIGILGNLGIQGEMAGTTTRRMLLSLGAEAKKTQELFGVLAVDAAGNARPAMQVLREIDAATKNMGSAERLAKFKELFELRGITGAAGLARAADEVVKLTIQLENAAGTAERTANMMDAGLGGSLRRARTAIETVAISIGKGLAPPLMIIAHLFREGAFAFKDWAEANGAVVTAVAVGVTAFTGLGVALIGLGVGVKLVAVAMTGLAVVMLPLNVAMWALRTAMAALTAIGAAAAFAMSAFAIVGEGVIITATGIKAAYVGMSVALQTNTALALLNYKVMLVLEAAGWALVMALKGIWFAMNFIGTAAGQATIRTWALAAAQKVWQGIILAGFGILVLYEGAVWALKNAQVAYNIVLAAAAAQWTAFKVAVQAAWGAMTLANIAWAATRAATILGTAAVLVFKGSLIALDLAWTVLTGTMIVSMGIFQGVVAVFAGVAAVVKGLALAMSLVASPLLLLGAGIAAVATAVAAFMGLFKGITSAFSQLGGAMSVLGGRFMAMGETFRTAWGGISDAMKAGDMELAMSIALKTLQLLWFQTLDIIKTAWMQFKQWFLQQTIDMADAIQAAFSGENIKTAALSATGVPGLQKLWGWLTGEEAPPGPPPKAAKTVSGPDSRIEDIGRIPALQKELADLAEQARLAAEAMRLEEERRKREQDEMTKRLMAMREEAEKGVAQAEEKKDPTKAPSFGTFNPFAAGLAGGRGPVERLIDMEEETQKILKSIREAVRRLAPTFG